MISTALNALGRWMGHSWLGEAGRNQFWLFPGAEVVHFFGLCLLFGAVLLIDLRLIGFGRGVPIKRVLAFVPVATVGLLLNTISGIIFLCAYPENYWPSTAFRLKLLAIILAGLNGLWFQWTEARRVVQLADEAETGWRTKSVALLSLTAWTIVIVLGRFLPYVSKSTS